MESYLSAGKKSDFALRCAEQLKQEGAELHPAKANGKKIARTFWGYAWCRNIETWQDYESRLPAGRSLLRAGGVIDLELTGGLITAKVADAAEGELRSVRIPIQAPDPERLDSLRLRCAGNIASLVDLVSGNLSEEILHAFCDPEQGLFPESHELKFICDCIDDSCLCRHAAAVLYGTGARLDDDPSLFFRLRGMKPELFFDTAAAAESLASENEIDTAALAETFGIDLEDL